MEQSRAKCRECMRMFSFPSNMLFIISGYPDQCEVVVWGSPLAGKVERQQWNFHCSVIWPHGGRTRF
jgi:hypothetical protein